jgi:hypothetical protein
MMGRRSFPGGRLISCPGPVVDREHDHAERRREMPDKRVERSLFLHVANQNQGPADDRQPAANKHHPKSHLTSIHEHQFMPRPARDALRDGPAPMRLRCIFCPWQSVVPGRTAVRAEVKRHVRAHENNPHPLIVHLPGWLLPWGKSV